MGLITNMMKLVKKIGYIILLMVFLTPMAVKFFHHHETIKYTSDSQQHSTSYQEKCTICAFEFSLFSQQNDKIFGQPVCFTDHYCNNYIIGITLVSFVNLFRLRAPPFRQI